MSENKSTNQTANTTVNVDKELTAKKLDELQKQLTETVEDAEDASIQEKVDLIKAVFTQHMEQIAKVEMEEGTKFSLIHDVTEAMTKLLEGLLAPGVAKTENCVKIAHRMSDIIADPDSSGIAVETAAGILKTYMSDN